MECKFGLQTITWGDPQEGIMEEILSTVSRIGYDGVELGWRRLACFSPTEMSSLLRKNNILLLGAHGGGNLEDPVQAESEQRQIDSIISVVKALGGTMLMYSGVRYENDEKLENDISSLNTYAALCNEHGIRLLYHNHDWEFRDGAKVFNALVTQTVPELGFCPDIGWIYKAGADSLDVLNSIVHRIGAVHFKDFITDNPAHLDTCCLGSGQVPLGEAAVWLKQQDIPSLWIIAEQDRCDGPAEEAAEKNYAFLEKCFRSMG